jgi:hypothetical protein
VLRTGEPVPEATLFLTPGEPMRVLELVEDRPALLLFYLFDFSST